MNRETNPGASANLGSNFADLKDALWGIRHGNDIFATRNRQFAAQKANRRSVCCPFSTEP